MELALIPCPLQIAIDPEHMKQKKYPLGVQLMGTLGSYEWEQLATDFLEASLEAGVWMGVKVAHRAHPNSDHGEMIAAGFLSEEEVEDGWVYALTPLAVTAIYKANAESMIRAQAWELAFGSRPTRYLARLRQFFTTRAKLFA